MLNLFVISLITAFPAFAAFSLDIKINAEDRTPYGIDWMTLEQYLPSTTSSSIVGSYSNNLYIIGGGTSTNIETISFENLNSSYNPLFWGKTDWNFFNDSSYKNVHNVQYNPASIQIDSLLYIMASSYSYNNSNILLIFDLKSERPIDGSTYNFKMPSIGEQKCSCMVSDGLMLYVFGGVFIDSDEWSNN